VSQKYSDIAGYEIRIVDDLAQTKIKDVSVLSSILIDVLLF